MDAVMHAASHIIISLIPIYVLLPGPGFIRTECRSPESTRTRAPRLIFWGPNSNKGLIQKAFLFMNEILQRAIQVLESCDCENGCPGCVHLNACMHGNAGLDKAGSRLLLQDLLGNEQVK